MLHRFCSKFHALSSSAKFLKIGYDLTKLQRVYRWKLFLRHGVESSAHKELKPTNEADLHHAPTDDIIV